VAVVAVVAVVVVAVLVVEGTAIHVLPGTITTTTNTTPVAIDATVGWTVATATAPAKV